MQHEAHNEIKTESIITNFALFSFLAEQLAFRPPNWCHGQLAQ